jgi:hypothetical protein
MELGCTTGKYQGLLRGRYAIGAMGLEGSRKLCGWTGDMEPAPIDAISNHKRIGNSGDVEF